MKIGRPLPRASLFDVGSNFEEKYVVLSFAPDVFAVLGLTEAVTIVDPVDVDEVNPTLEVGEPIDEVDLDPLVHLVDKAVHDVTVGRFHVKDAKEGAHDRASVEEARIVTIVTGLAVGREELGIARNIDVTTRL